MITSNQIIKLSEEWLMSAKGTYSPDLVNIYVNPTSSDYLELRKEKVQFLRFIADNRNKKIYVANAIHILHDDMVRNIGGFTGLKTDYTNFSLWLLAGNASLSGNTSDMTRSDMIQHLWQFSSDTNNSISERKKVRDILNKILATDWSWCDRYVKVTNWLSQFKKRLDG